MSTDLEIIRQKITDLYRYRDEYFLKINENEWPQKQAAIEIKIKVCFFLNLFGQLIH